MLLVYVKDMPEGLSSYMKMFADDGKMSRQIVNRGRCKQLESDLSKVYEWSKSWRKELIGKKWHMVEMERGGKRPKWQYKMGEEEIRKTK